MKKGRTWISWLLLLALCLSLCACSPAPQSGEAQSSGTQGGTSRPKQNSEPVKMAEEAQKNVVQRLASTQVEPPEDMNLDWQSGLVTMDGRLYVHATGFEKPHLICSYDMDGGDRQVLSAYDGAPIKGIGASDHGTLFVLNNAFNEETRLYEYTLRELDKDGRELKRLELKGAGYPEDFFPFWMVSDGETVYLLGNGWLSLFSMGDQIEHLCDLAARDSQRLGLLPDGRLILDTNAGGQYAVMVFDKESRSFGAPIPFDKGGSLLCGGGRWNVYITDGTSAYGLDLETGKLEKQFEWLSVGIVGRALIEAPEGGFFAADGNNRLFRMRQVDVEVGESGEPETMTLVVLDRLFLASYLEDAILDWNRAHPECMIVVRDYFTGQHSNDWQQQEQATEEARKAMAMDIITGNVHPDLFDLSSLNAASLAVSGKLENLYPYLDADPVLSRESFYPSVLEAQEIRGGLYEVVTNYSLLTVTGFASEVGSARSWEELLRLADSTDRCERLFTAESWGRMGFLQLLTDASGKRLVDWDSGECYFDTPYFISILEAVMQLPEQAVEPEDYYSEQHSLVDGEGLLTLSEYGDLWQGANAGKQYGEGNWTIVGLPELGSVIKPYSTLGASALGMAADSQHKEECWAFLRTFYLNPRPYAFSAMQGGLEESIQGQLQQREQEGLMDKWLNAEADMRAFADAFTGATVLYRHDDAVWEIVQAEASRYFAGQVSAEDCAKVIQSRARIYISEQGR